jgi:hypothetical protein
MRGGFILKVILGVVSHVSSDFQAVTEIHQRRNLDYIYQLVIYFTTYSVLLVASWKVTLFVS